ncbi:MAG: thioredoxin family protein [Actinomycetes bacterium]
MSLGYATDHPTRDEIDDLDGATVLQFGTDWCGYCRAAERYVEPTVGEADGVRHIKVEDGKGRPLGRSFRVKLWPTLVFLRDGEEVARVVRPSGRTEVEQALARIA